MPPTLKDLIASAIALAEEARDLLAWEAQTEELARQLDHAAAEPDTSTPARLSRICRRLDTLIADVESGQRLSTAIHQGVQRYEAERPDETAVVIGEQQTAAAEQRQRQLAVRQRVRDLERRVGQDVMQLRNQPLDERIARVMAGRDFDLSDALKALAADHHEVGEAYADWRLMRAGGATVYVEGSSSPAETTMALSRLVHAERATERRRFLRPTRWSVPSQG